MSFVVDLSELDDRNDIRSDDLGAWRNVGVHNVFASVSFNDDDSVKRVTILGSQPPNVTRSTIYKVKKTYWRHKVASDFSRKLFEILDHKDIRYNYCLLQYQFDANEHPIPEAPHGNSKGSSSTYNRTKSSVQKNIKKEAFSKSPTELLDKLQGDVCIVESCGSIPRNRQQIVNTRKTMKSHVNVKDTLFTVMETCKKEQSKSNPYIRRVVAAPEPICLLCYDRQLHDLERFCCDENDFCVLGVDATFNLGEFLVTITTYKHLLLKDRNSDKPPVMIGPALIHQTRKTDSYYALASGIVGLHPALVNLLSFGTDGERAIGNAFSLQFQKATHLLCFLHVKRDIQRKLHDLGIPEKCAKKYIQEIFGFKSDSQFNEGLVDCETPLEFDTQLKNCCSSWNQREISARDTTKPVFHEWFTSFHSDLVKKKMLKCVRKKAGLGDPPEPYTTNANESINSRVKKKVDYKASELHQFCQIMQELVDTQFRNVERSFTIGNGPYVLDSLYSDLIQSGRNWPKLSTTTKEKFLKKIQAFRVRRRSACSQISASSFDADVENFPPLSLLFDDTGLSTDVYKSMWDKASMLFHRKFISPVPGFDSGRMVGSISHPEKPHLVSGLTSGKFVCDCLNYKSKSLCSHVIATAETMGKLPDLINWFKRTQQEPNMWNLARSSGLPKHPGNKPGQNQRKRSRLI